MMSVKMVIFVDTTTAQFHLVLALKLTVVFQVSLYVYIKNQSGWYASEDRIHVHSNLSKNYFFPVIPPFFEADYLEIVKDLPDISLGPSSGYEYYRKLSVYGPNSFPVLTDHDGYAYIVAGNFGKVGQFNDSSLITIFLKYLS